MIRAAVGFAAALLGVPANAETLVPYQIVGHAIPQPLTDEPGDPARVPRQFAPYHLRLDWLMWFAAFSTPDEHPWFSALVVRLLEGNRETLSLLRSNPFPDRPPRYVRALLYQYRLSPPEVKKKTRQWWVREKLGVYFPTVSLDSPALRMMLLQMRWIDEDT